MEKVPALQLEKSIISSKAALVKEIAKIVLQNRRNEYYNSIVNLLRSLNIYYSHNVMGKAKYKSMRKTNNVKESSVPNFVPCDKLAKYIMNSILVLSKIFKKFMENI